MQRGFGKRRLLVLNLLPELRKLDFQLRWHHIRRDRLYSVLGHPLEAGADASGQRGRRILVA